MDLSIYDAEGKIIHSENVDSQKNINRTYDLKALPERSYFSQAESDTKISRYAISVVGEKLYYRLMQFQRFINQYL